jgi:hypothetical protein
MCPILSFCASRRLLQCVLPSPGARRVHSSTLASSKANNKSKGETSGRKFGFVFLGIVSSLGNGLVIDLLR